MQITNQKIIIIEQLEDGNLFVRFKQHTALLYVNQNVTVTVDKQLFD